MANTISHGSVDVVNSTAKVTDAALANVYANAAGSVVANNTQLFTVTVDKKGRIKSIQRSKKSYIANAIAKIILDKLLTNDKNIN